MGDVDRPLNGKRILLLAPFFYKYEVAIADKLESYGAEVAYYDADPKQLYGNFVLACKIKGIRYKELARLFERKLYRKIENKKYDYVLVMCGSNVTSWLVKKIRFNFLTDEGKMYLYNWDSLKNLRDDNKRWDYFDKRYTFDRQDWLNHPDEFEFLPLFYCDEYDVTTMNNKVQLHDISIVGSFNVYRYSLLNSLRSANPEIDICGRLFAKKNIVNFYKLIRKKYSHVNLDDLMYKKMNAHEITQLYKQSASVIDVPYLGQSGQTMRMLECMAMRKKVITTNADVVNYDFYNPENIYVLNDDMKLPEKDWFQRPYEAIDESILKKYCIDSWLKRILEL